MNGSAQMQMKPANVTSTQVALFLQGLNSVHAPRGRVVGCVEEGACGGVNDVGGEQVGY
jgi:hypothetical protein